jgi:nucleoside-diphosphate-sugar epimerase
MAATPSTSPLQGKPVLVTGATGFLGARLVERLVRDHGAKVTAAVRNPQRAVRIKGLDVALTRIDLDGQANPEAMVAGQEIVFNLAYDFRRSAADNLAGFDSLTAACVKAGVGRFVQVSSIAVYDAWPVGELTEASPCDGPGYDYKVAKREMERRLLASSLPAVMLQPTLIYGPDSAQWTDRYAQQLRYGIVVLPAEGQGLCNAVHVDEVVDALILAATAPGAVGETFIISGAQPMTWAQLLGSYAQAVGRPQALSLVQMEPPPPPQPGGSSGGGGLGALANTPAVRKVLGLVEAALGERAIEQLRKAALKAQSRGGTLVHSPDAETYRLFTAQGPCRVDKAGRLLGYKPAADPAPALAQTADYVRRRFV